MIDYQVVWGGARGDYLDTSLNAPPVRQAAPGRTIAVRVRPTPSRPRGASPASVRSRLQVVLTNDWQTVRELMAAAGLAPDRKTQSNASASLSTLFCHGDAERVFQRIAATRGVHRAQYCYRKPGPPGVSETP